MRNFHLPLDEEMHAQLRKAAASRRQPATVLAREAIHEWLKAKRLEAVRVEITEYAVNHAGVADLDEDLESAAVEQLLGEGA